MRRLSMCTPPRVAHLTTKSPRPCRGLLQRADRGLRGVALGRRVEVPPGDAVQLATQPPRHGGPAVRVTRRSCLGVGEDLGVLDRTGGGHRGRDLLFLRQGRRASQPQCRLPARFDDLLGHPLQLLPGPRVCW